VLAQDKTTIIYEADFRQVRMNRPHPTQVTPSWYVDSVGRYTLVIDTVGIKAKPYSINDLCGMPHTSVLHVGRTLSAAGLRSHERRIGASRESSETASASTLTRLQGKGLQLEFTVDDDGVFTTPWSATITYRRGINSRGTDEWLEFVCAENPHLYYAAKDMTRRLRTSRTF
jgi:hypothetical protein